MRLRLATRVLIAGLTLGFVMILVLVTTLVALNRSSVAHDREQSAAFAALALAELESVTVGAQSGVRGYVITGQDRFLEAYRTSLNRLPAIIRDFKLAVAGKPDEQAASEAIEIRVDRFVDDYARPTIAVARRSRAQAAEIIADGGSKNQVDAIKRLIAQLMKQEHERAADAGDSADTATAWALRIAIVGLTLTIAMFAALVYFAAAKVAQPIEQITNAASKLQSGDLSARVPATPKKSAPETAALADAFNEMAVAIGDAHTDLEDHAEELESQQESLREAHVKLLEREQLLGAMVASAVSAVGVFDELALTVANEKLRDLIAANGLEMVIGHPERLDEEPSRDYVELEVDGASRSFLRNRAPIVIGGKTTSAKLIVLHDMTQERDLERARDEFFSVVSHELRTPLTAVIGYVEALDELERPGDDRDRTEIVRERRHDLDVLTRNVKQLNRLVSDIFTVTQINAGQFPMQFTTSPLAPVVEDAVEGARPAAARGVNLNLELLDHPTARMDPERIRQVIDNLLSNAIKFTPAGGRVEVALKSSKTEARIRVSDTGTGIPKDKISRLFERFYRSEPTGERLPEGLGLGLSIVKAILDEHGGQIFVDSEVGKYTNFSVTLPVEESTSAIPQS